MACMWNSPYIFLDKNKQSRAYMCRYAWCEIEGLMASGHKDHPYIVYMWVGMFNDNYPYHYMKQTTTSSLKTFCCFPVCPPGSYHNSSADEAVSITDCPPVDNPTDASNPKMEKGYFINFLCNLPYCFWKYSDWAGAVVH